LKNSGSIKLQLYKSATQLLLHAGLKLTTKKYSLLLLLLVLIFCNSSIAQPTTTFYVKDTKAANRTRLYKSLVSNINKNLSLPLADSTEENWMDAFYSIELLRYKSPWVDGRIHEAFKGIEKRSDGFQQSLMELVYDGYPDGFQKEVEFLLDTATNIKCITTCAAYLLKSHEKCKTVTGLKIQRRIQEHPDTAIFKAFNNRFFTATNKLPPLKDLLQHHFFDNDKLVISFQRKNRNYPGLVIVRDSAGNFVKDEYGNVFSVPQLARSISNLPGFISNGNTPQGIFRMHGFDVSRSVFLGPTPNIQLTMPVETSIQHFMNDSTIIDSIWTEDWYRKLLPESWKAYPPFFETYYAGKAGRTEIIAHGTTVDPNYYKGQPYYPLTPTLGCLCTKEIWSEEDGTRKQSDQQKLVDALKKAGGADGYFIVIELNDEQRAVDLSDILSLLK